MGRTLKREIRTITGFMVYFPDIYHGTIKSSSIRGSLSPTPSLDITAAYVYALAVVQEQPYTVMARFRAYASATTR